MKKFGITLLGLPTLRTVKLCKAAEDVGFDNAWIADESPSPPFRDATVNMTAILLETRKIKVGSSIFVPYTRHPALLAVFMSTLNELAEGRLILGLGPGGSLMMTPLGIQMWDRPLTALREATIIIKRLFSGDIVTFEGEVFKLKEAYLPEPPKTSVPIYLAARGPKMLELAGEVADGCLLSVPGDYVGSAIELVKKGAESMGRRLEDVQIANMSLFDPDSDKRKAIDLIKPRTTHMVADSPNIVYERSGIDLERVEAIRQAIRRGSREEALCLITDDIVEKMSIVGSVEECSRKIEEQFKAGLNQIIFNIPRDIVSEELIKQTGERIVQVLKG